MSSELLPNGIGTTESQLDWTLWSVTEDVALDGTCSKRKRAFFKMSLPRVLTILERSARIAHPKPAPWHITIGVCDVDEIATHVFDMNWSGYWFRHMCRAADILKIPCSDQRFVNDDKPWDRWGKTIDLQLEQRIGQVDKQADQLISCGWDLTPLYLGRRFPRKQESVCECSISLPEESEALARLAEQARRSEEAETLEIPAVLQKYFSG